MFFARLEGGGLRQPAPGSTPETEAPEKVS